MHTCIQINTITRMGNHVERASTRNYKHFIMTILIMSYTGCPEKNYTWQKNINIITKRAFIQLIFFCKNIVTLSNHSIQFSECSFVSPSSTHTLIHRTTHFPDKSSALSQFVVRNAPRCVLRYYGCKFQLFFSYRAWLG